MTLDLEKLLAPVAGEDPTGPDLAYDPQRHQIEQAFDSSVSIDASGVAEAAGETDWRPIIAAIADQSERTKDVWLPVYLCRAGARGGQLAIVETGARALAGLLERFWERAHPRLEEYGFLGRKGACDTLASFREFVGPLGRIVLVEHGRLGRFTAEDIIRFHRGGEGEEGYGPFRAALAEGSLEGLADAAQRVEAIRDSFRRADVLLMDHAGSEGGTNFAPVYECLAAIAGAIDAFLPRPEVAIEEGGAEEGEAAAATSGSGARVSGTVRSRDDVVRVLDLVVDYYRRSEPASPVPMLLERAKAWVVLDFMTVLQDIAPGALDDARMLLQSRLGG
ncbi:type VI secretion system protein TssA [Sphingomonas sp. PR090111-T3T-6A]|uniref:type VI secretion system protein TssA n=1 Tax=Sphingomonas sp. PR090111-T3T-6A TaxID=685778 RepID=UPI0003762FC1|nr:type VI secretion system ImpA family N-terminal domain-containing protein [Sphingomonas sp. PR090111-T3T-6A]